MRMLTWTVLAAVATQCITPAHAFILNDGIVPPEIYPHIGASFGPSPHEYNVTGHIGISDPIGLCSPAINDNLKGKIALILRGDCTFDTKVINAQHAGAVGAIIGDNRDYFEQQMMVADYGDTDEQQIEIPSIMCMKATYLHITNLLENPDINQTAITATLDTTGLLFAPNDNNTADDVLSEFAMIYPIMYCLYSLVQWWQVFKQNRAEERTRLAALQARPPPPPVMPGGARLNGHDRNGQYQQVNGNSDMAHQRTTVHNVNVQPAVRQSTSTSSLAALPLGVNDSSNDTPRTALLHMHNMFANSDTADELNQQQRTYNRVVYTLRTVSRLTSANAMFTAAVVIYSIYFVTAAVLTALSWSENDCVISVRWLLVLRMCCAWLSIRHAYSQTHSEADAQPYLDKAQHLVWWSMIAFNSAWLWMSPVDSHRCAAVAPIAYTSINIMFYCTLAWILVSTILHMICNSSWISSGLTLVVLRGIMKYLQLGWIISGALDRPEPVTTLELQYLPTIKYARGMFVREGDTEPPSCAICMCEYTEGEQIRQLSCGHHFGRECIDNWLTIKSSCPTCRSSVLSNLTDETNETRVEQQV